jgi:argininosuccinate lyase
VPFRRAHEIVGKAVLLASERGCGLRNVPLEEYRKLSPLIREDVYDALSLEASVGRRTSYGGTAPSNLKKRLQALKKKMR